MTQFCTCFSSPLPTVTLHIPHGCHMVTKLHNKLGEPAKGWQWYITGSIFQHRSSSKRKSRIQANNTMTQMKPELLESQVYRNQDLTFSLAKIQAVYLLCLNAAWQNLQPGRNFPVETCLLYYLLILNISLLFQLINTLKGDL